MDKGMSLATAASSFIASSEFQARYGSAPSNGDLLTKLYSMYWDALRIKRLRLVADADEQRPEQNQCAGEFAQSAENQSASHADWQHRALRIPNGWVDRPVSRCANRP